MNKNAWNAAEYVAPDLEDVETADIGSPVETSNLRSRFSGEVTVHPFDESTALTQEWDKLAIRIGASPYLRPGWVAAWWRAFGTGKLEIHVLRKNQRLAAVLPVARKPDMVTSLANPHTPRFGLLAEDSDSATELAQTLFADRPRRVSMGALDTVGISLKACWRAAEDAGYRFIHKPYQTSPYLDITENWADYEAKLAKMLRANLRRCQRNLEKLGTVSVRVINGCERLEEHLAEAFSIEASGWKGTNRTAILSNPDTKQFYTDVARWATTQGMLRIFFLRLNEQSIAMEFVLIDKGICYLMKAGYNETYAQHGPGRHLLHAAIRHCFTERISRIEFQGDADEYKFQWANAVHTQKRFEAFSPSLAGQLLWAITAYGKPTAKYILQNLGLRKRAKKHEFNGVVYEN